LLKSGFTRIPVPLYRCKAGSRIEGAEHKIGCNQTMISDEGMQHTTPTITLTENNQKYLFENCSNSMH
jgi:hypothetical protein